MRDIPIIFSAPMVQALLAGRKTMTRRLLYSERIAKKGVIPASCTFLESWPPPMPATDKYFTLSPWQKVKPGDRLWVRENLTCIGDGKWRYMADQTHVTMSSTDPRRAAMVAWAHHEERGSVPSIHMPRWASRLTLTVTATKIEKVQDISEADAMAEGCRAFGPHPGDPHDGVPIGGAVDAFEQLWKNLHGPDLWEANPAVVAITDTVHQCNIDQMPKAA